MDGPIRLTIRLTRPPVLQGVVVIRPETSVAIRPESCVAIRPITRKKMCGNDCYKTNYPKIFHSKIPRTLLKPKGHLKEKNCGFDFYETNDSKL